MLASCPMTLGGHHVQASARINHCHSPIDVQFLVMANNDRNPTAHNTDTVSWLCVFKNFVKLIFISYWKSWYHGIFVEQSYTYHGTKNSMILFSTMWKNEKFSLTKKNSSNQLFALVISFKNVTFTKCLLNRENICKFHTVFSFHSVVISEIFPHCKNFPSNWFAV